MNKEQKKKISIITICYNAEKVIKKTMISVLEQTFEDMEYLIVDGASNDKTLQYVYEVCKLYPHKIVRVFSEHDSGIYNAMNKGIRLAKGEWVNMMNAGDVFEDKNILYDIFSHNLADSIGCIYSDFNLKYPNGEIKKECASIETGNMLHQAFIYRKELHYTYGFYAETKPIIASDFLFMCMIPKEKYYKTESIICTYDMTGLSNSGDWCGLSLLGIRYVFNIEDKKSVYKKMTKEYLKLLCPNIIMSIYRKIKILI